MTLHIGWSSREITPQRPALLQGQKYVRIGRRAADPLTVTALALEGRGGGDKAILVSCDLPMVPGALQQAVRALVRRRLPDLPGDAVVLNGTHTHDALVIVDGSYPHPGGDVMTGAEGLAWVAERAAEAVVEAWDQRVPRQLGRAFGHAVVGHNRRAVYADGRAVMYGKTNSPTFSHIEGYEDHSLDMLFVWELDGRLAGIILDIPCPSQVEEHLKEFSADYWYEIRTELRRRYGQHLFILPLCGAAGDQSPHFLLYDRQEEDMRRRLGVTERQEIAWRVAEAVARALPCTQPFAGEVAFAHLCRQVAFSPRQISRGERDWAAKELAWSISQGEQPELWWPKKLHEVIDLFDRGEPMPSFQAELHALRLGDAVVVTNPFELYLDFGLQIKARSRAAQTIVVQLAGGSGMYLPTERAVQGGHYGAHPVVAPVGPEGGRELVEATLGAVSELFPETATDPK